MTEYWVSKKQYWCKYCSIFIRDDAPSRRQHETGLKHQGNKERFIRDLYKTGNRAKIERAQEAVELAKIDAAAAASGDTSAKLSTLETLRSQAPSHRPREASRPKDKYANYTSAADLGILADEEKAKSSYEIEQDLKGRAGNVGAWEEVDYEPSGAYTLGLDRSGDDQGEGSHSAAGPSSWEGTGAKRKLGEYRGKTDEDHEDFKIRQRRDVWVDEDEEWDPRKAIKGKVKAVPGVSAGQEAVKLEETKGVALDREKWTGKLELKEEGKGREGLVYVTGGGWVKSADNAENDNGNVPTGTIKEEIKPDVQEESKPDIPPAADSVQDGTGKSGPPASRTEEDAKSAIQQEVENSASSGLFKKRRPPPSSRKK